jgi:hypothetical protein
MWKKRGLILLVPFFTPWNNRLFTGEAPSRSLLHLWECLAHDGPDRAKVHEGHHQPQFTPHHKRGAQQQHMAVLEAAQQGSLSHQGTLQACVQRFRAGAASQC